MGAFDGNGNFVRTYSWQSDAANSIDITASRMDTEDDGFASGLSACVTRDGQGKMSADFTPAQDNMFNCGTNALRWASFNGIPAASFVPPTQTSIGQLLYPQTATETAAGVTPTNYIYPAGHVFRYYSAAQITQTLAFTATPTLDCSPAINTAIKCSTGDVYFPTGIHYINAPIYIPTTANPNLRFVGESRTNTKIEPMANSIADALNINAMIINQQNNGKFSLYRIRPTTGDAPGLQTAWAGFSIHAVQPQAWSSVISYVAGAIVTNGGSTYCCTAASLNNAPPNASFWSLCGTNGAGYTAGGCNYIFSGSMEECWFDAASVQPMFVGGLNNYHVINNTFEFMKGCFSITGGTADTHFVSNTMSNCFDYFIQATQSPNANIIRVNGLNVYTHIRGNLFSFINAWALQFESVMLQPQPSAVVGNNIGLGSFVSCNDIQIDNCNTLTSATLGTGASATILTFQGCSGEISDCNFDGCDTGILLTNTATNRLSFDHVDIVNSNTAALRVNVGAPAGSILVSDSNWSDCQQTIVLGTTAGTFDLYMSNVRLMNAGLNANIAQRNFAIATSGFVRLSDCIIGQNNAGAAAQYYLDAAGTGDLLLVNPVFVGTPPGAIQNPSATQKASIGFFTVPYSASMTFSAQYWEKFVITATNGTAFTINAPTSPMLGKVIQVMIRNTSGGALGAVTWNAVFKMSSWTQPGNNNSRSIGFQYDGSNWVQVSQTGTDVPN